METPENVSQSPLTVSSVQEIREKAKQTIHDGIVVEMPSGIKVRLARPTLAGMLKRGRIPSNLVSVALKQAQGGTTLNAKEVLDAIEVMDILLMESFKDPVLVKENPNEGQISMDDLTDEDRAFAFQYIQTGKVDLSFFRSK